MRYSLRLTALAVTAALLAGCASQPELVQKTPQQMRYEQSTLKNCQWERETWPDEPPMPYCRNLPAHIGQPTKPACTDEPFGDWEEMCFGARARMMLLAFLGGARRAASPGYHRYHHHRYR